MMRKLLMAVCLVLMCTLSSCAFETTDQQAEKTLSSQQAVWSSWSNIGSYYTGQPAVFSTITEFQYDEQVHIFARNSSDSKIYYKRYSSWLSTVEQDWTEIPGQTTTTTVEPAASLAYGGTVNIPYKVNIWKVNTSNQIERVVLKFNRTTHVWSFASWITETDLGSNNKLVRASRVQDSTLITSIQNSDNSIYVAQLLNDNTWYANGLYYVGGFSTVAADVGIRIPQPVASTQVYIFAKTNNNTYAWKESIQAISYGPNGWSASWTEIAGAYANTAAAHMLKENYQFCLYGTTGNIGTNYLYENCDDGSSANLSFDGWNSIGSSSSMINFGASSVCSDGAYAASCLNANGRTDYNSIVMKKCGLLSGCSLYGATESL